MKPKPFFLTWIITSVVMIAVNGVFHGVAAAGFFDDHLAVLGNAVVKMKDFNPIPVIILELILIFCLVLIITRFKNDQLSMRESVLTGGLFYLSTSATWNLANAATLVTWPHIVTVVDVLWHFVSGLLAGWIIYKLFNRQFVSAKSL